MIIEVIIASTSRFAKYGKVSSPDGAKDSSGKIILERIEAAGYEHSYHLLPDSIEQIRDAVESSVADAIIICGGTGLAPLDLTLEAVQPLFEKEMPGFGEIFRLRSAKEVGTRVILTRAAAGVYHSKPIFCIPGSPNAAKLGIELIMKEVEHIIEHIVE